MIILYQMDSLKLTVTLIDEAVLSIGVAAIAVVLSIDEAVIFSSAVECRSTKAVDF